MSDVTQLNIPPNANVVDAGNPSPPATPEPVPTVEAVDERGVPYKNVAAEFARKLAEAEALNQRYAVALGQQPQATPMLQVPANDELSTLEKQFDEPTRKFLNLLIEKKARDIAQETGYRLMTQASHASTVGADPELLAEARTQYNALKQNPLWARVDDTLVQDRAIAEARSVLATRRPQPANSQPARPNQTIPNTTSLPATRPAQAPPPVDDKEKWIAEYQRQPETLETFRIFFRHQYNPADERDVKQLRSVAETAWGGIRFGGSVAMAHQALRTGQAETMGLGNVQEVRS